MLRRSTIRTISPSVGTVPTLETIMRALETVTGGILTVATLALVVEVILIAF